MNLIKIKNYFFAFSLAFIVPSIIGFSIWGLKLGIDFTGGTLWEVKFGDSRPSSAQEFERFLNENGIQVSTVSATQENSILVRMKESDESQISQIRDKVDKTYGHTDDLRLETVGPIISHELTQKALMAVGFSILAIVIYVTWSFRKVPKPTSSIAFGLCTIVALVHDVIIVVGVFVFLGRSLNVEVDTLFITALLTTIGFSVHDTIVVFDRIRENLRRYKDLAFEKVVNNSLLETFARSLNTSLTAVFVLIALLLFGGATIKIFVLALLIGIITGTYSSIFIAAPLLVVWHNLRSKKV